MRGAPTPAVRPATGADLPALRALVALAIAELQRGFLPPDAVAASARVMGLDTQLVADGTYFAVELGGRLAGCGGWSRRATLYGGDGEGAAAPRDASLLDPRRDAARVRAMYTHPAFVRRGVGRLLLAHCERAAAAEGFRRAELMATLAGEPLYRACGYAELERVEADAGGGARIPLVRMGKALA